MLDKFRETAITWDKATRRIYSPITANASDSNGRKLNIQVVNSGQVENLTGATLHLYWETKDKAHYGLDAFDASDISKGEFEIFYTTGMLSNVGELDATLVLVDGTGKVVSDWFKITVTRGINEGAIESENSFSSLTQALIDISNLETKYAPRLNDLTAQLQQTEQNLNAQLAQTENWLKLFNDFTRYGKVKLFGPFDRLPFELHRGFDGKITHNFKIESLTSGYKNVYVSGSINSANTYDGLTEESPVRTLRRALEVADALSEGTVNIVYMDNVIGHAITLPDDKTFHLNKNINIMSKQGTLIHTGNLNRNYVWEKIDNVYRVTRSSVRKVVDSKNKNFLNKATPLSEVDSVGEVKQKRGTWFLDGDILYVNTFDGREPDDDIGIVLPYNSLDIVFYTGNHRLSFINMDFDLISLTEINDTIQVRGGGSGVFYGYNSSFSGSKKNGLAIVNVENTFLFNCLAYDNGSDGFNYHGTVENFVFEYNCYAHSNGKVIQTTGNATTAHDGMTIVRVGSIGHDCFGPVLADVNGCKSLNIDCHMSDSLITDGPTKTAFWFDNAGSSGRVGEFYLVNCSGGGIDTHSINSDGAEVFIKNFKGNDIPKPNTIKPLNS